MKKLLYYTLIATLFCYGSLWAQEWETNGNDINNTNTGNIGIGTDDPQSKLHVFETAVLEDVAITIQNKSTWDPVATSSLLFTHNVNNFSGGKISSIREANYLSGDANTAHSSLAFYTAKNGLDQEHLRITSNGKVGIGTTNPGAGLHVVNDLGILIDDSQTGFQGAIKMTDGFSNTTTKDDMLFESDGAFLFKLDKNGNGISNYPGFGIFDKNNTTIFFAKDNGNVGIGTAAPQTTLHVAGDFRVDGEIFHRGVLKSQEIKVEIPNGTWKDYVFEKDYQLRTLEEVEDFIAKNKHLPEIPSEAEVKANGINLGEMDAKLLQKIEELTLYTIQQDKTLKQQQQIMETQQKQFQLLQQQNEQLLKRIETIENQ